MVTPGQIVRMVSQKGELPLNPEMYFSLNTFSAEYAVVHAQYNYNLLHFDNLNFEDFLFQNIVIHVLSF